MATFIERMRERARTGLNEVQDRITEFEERGGVDQWTSSLGARLRDYEERLTQAQHRLLPDYQADLSRWNARLELDRGATVADVRSAYQRLMRRYHPDRYSGDDALEKMATRLSQELSVAYNGLLAHLDRRRPL